MIEEKQAARLLAIDNPDTTTFHAFRTGFRTRAVLATNPGVAHRFLRNYERVVVKLYTYERDTTGSRGFQDYHEQNFHTLESLTGNKHIQQSIAGGFMTNVGSYAVVQYIDGEELKDRLERADLTKQQASVILRDILERIWIPLWNGGLRFKDCHPGNFVLTPDVRVVMIDTEQMRKDVSELILTPNSWAQRNAHQDNGLARLPRLMERVIKAANPTTAKARVLREVKSSLNDSGLSELLKLLSKPDGSVESTVQALNVILEDLKKKGLIA